MVNSKDNKNKGPERQRRKRKNVVPPTTITMLSIRTIARKYDFHENTVRRWITEDGLPFIRYGPGGKIFIAEEAVNDFIERYYY